MFVSIIIFMTWLEFDDFTHDRLTYAATLLSVFLKVYSDLPSVGFYSHFAWICSSRCTVICLLLEHIWSVQ